MQIHDPPPTPPEPRTVRELMEVTHQTPDKIRRDARRGVIAAMRPGTEYLFDAEQWTAAVAHYGRAVKRKGKERSERTIA